MAPLTLYKATNPQGFDFRTGKTIDYAGALETGRTITHPTSKKIVVNKAATYLSVSVEPAETLIGGSWPARLFRVEAVGNVVDGLEASRYKRAVLGLKVVEELPAWMVFGPNGEDVVAIIERVERLTPDEAKRMIPARDAAEIIARIAARDAARIAAWDAARIAAWDAARDAAGSTAWNAAESTAWNAARDAAIGTTVRDLITQEQYDLLMAPWRAGVGDWK